MFGLRIGVIVVCLLFLPFSFGMLYLTCRLLIDLVAVDCWCGRAVTLVGACWRLWVGLVRFSVLGFDLTQLAVWVV